MPKPRMQVFILTMMFFIYSCKRVSKQLDVKHYWDCHAAGHYDSSTLASRIPGMWQWKETSYGGQGIKKADKVTKITFTDAGEFSIFENSDLITKGKWGLKKVDGNMFGLEVDKPNTYLWGKILLCEPEILFNDSYRDGDDVLFYRTK